MVVSVFVKAPLMALMVAIPTPDLQEQAIDRDGDGQYSLAELQTAAPDVRAGMFAVLDVSSDGLLNADEIAYGVLAGVLPQE